MQLEARCQTTAMGIMPHTDIDRAMELALSLDIPFWPQLPKLSFHEDMYVQASQHFPGMIVDQDNQTITLSHTRFAEELAGYSQQMANPDTFSLTEDYSLVYHQFLARDIANYAAVRGQVIGPVSFGFKVADEDKKPIIYDDGIRALLFDFIQKKVNSQYQQLRQKNRNAFVWLDEPGLGWVFSGLSGYNDIQTKQDYRDFLNGVAGPWALHLCANVNLPYLLELGVEIISFDALQMEIMPRGYADAVAQYITRGGIICWGIVPTVATSLSQETAQTLAGRLSDYWEVVAQNTGLVIEQIALQSLVAPARCCLKNLEQTTADNQHSRQTANACAITTVEEEIVEAAFTRLRELSAVLRERYRL